jgi:Zn-finger nucleic acid-binding protein
MNCPTCKDVQLAISDRQGVEIDYCPSCRGVWLDRGELDKLIERSATYERRRDRDDDDDDRRPHGGQGHRKKKKHSFLEEIFDFG